MNCDEFLEALESADEQVRAAAGQHANSCTNCGELADIHSRLQKELSTVEPLSLRLRAVWEAAAEDGVPETTLSPRFRQRPNFAPRLIPLYLFAITVAVLFLVVIPLLFWQIYPGKEVVIKPDKGTLPATPVVVTNTIDASVDLDKLLAQLNSLEAQLNKTSKQAELLDARREADVLLAIYNHW